MAATLRDKMLRAWYMDNSDLDQREPHRLESSDAVSLNQLAKLGVLYWKLDPVNYNEDGILDRIRNERGYTYTDIIAISRDKLPNYEEKIKSFFEEHLHADEEIRFVLEGSGYFDVRDKQDEWVRIEVLPGDLIVLPAGIYHRFTLDTKNYIKAMRLFKGEPVWTPVNRPADNHPARKSYVNKFAEIA